MFFLAATTSLELKLTLNTNVSTSLKLTILVGSWSGSQVLACRTINWLLMYIRVLDYLRVWSVSSVWGDCADSTIFYVCIGTPSATASIEHGFRFSCTCAKSGEMDSGGMLNRVVKQMVLISVLCCSRVSGVYRQHSRWQASRILRCAHDPWNATPSFSSRQPDLQTNDAGVVGLLQVTAHSNKRTSRDYQIPFCHSSKGPAINQAAGCWLLAADPSWCNLHTTVSYSCDFPYLAHIARPLELGQMLCNQDYSEYFNCAGWHGWQDVNPHWQHWIGWRYAPRPGHILSGRCGPLCSLADQLMGLCRWSMLSQLLNSQLKWNNFRTYLRMSRRCQAATWTVILADY